MQAQGLNPHGTLNPSGPVFLDVDNLIDYMNVIFHFRDEDAPLSQPLDKNRPTRRVPRAAFRVDQAMMTRYMEMLENAAVADPGPFETVAIWPDSGAGWGVEQSCSSADAEAPATDTKPVTTRDQRLTVLNDRIRMVSPGLMVSPGHWRGQKGKIPV